MHDINIQLLKLKTAQPIHVQQRCEELVSDNNKPKTVLGPVFLVLHHIRLLLLPSTAVLTTMSEHRDQSN